LGPGRPAPWNGQEITLLEGQYRKTASTHCSICTMMAWITSEALKMVRKFVICGLMASRATFAGAALNEAETS
jgi:hypothetical protein